MQDATESDFTRQSTATNLDIPKESYPDIFTSLAHDITAFKRHGNPTFADIKILAERVWAANIRHEASILNLEKQKKEQIRRMEKIWGAFDTLIKPLWRIDDDIVPVYDALSQTLLELEEICADRANLCSKTVASDVAEQSAVLDARIAVVQMQLHDLEVLHVVDGKFVPKDWQPGNPIPSGQAMLSNLLAKCHRLIRTLQTSDCGFAPVLLPTRLKLESAIASLKEIWDCIISKKEFEPLEITAIQVHIDVIEQSKVDGKFLDADGHIPEGQALLQDLLEEAYNLIHNCLVEIEPEASHPITQKIYDALTVLGQDGIGKTSVLTHSVYETISQGFSHVMESQGKTAKKLIGSVRVGLACIANAFSGEEAIDPTLVSIQDSLLSLKKLLLQLRNKRDRLRALNLTRCEMDEAEIEEAVDVLNVEREIAFIESLRNEKGLFVNSEGGAPKEGQNSLKALVEECYMLMYELN